MVPMRPVGNGKIDATAIFDNIHYSCADINDFVTQVIVLTRRDEKTNIKGPSVRLAVVTPPKSNSTIRK